ncbi:hypothetical protein [Helicovermis profundi]|uniref:Uncharacterized protein n=1 Tax=Helicovermis profundi TaxID=3065157 RepID=A0AAU9EQB6_9FIRM|nr:hypothetical protein HLPR_18870 [Clostridia bacterium S502]
MKNKYIAERDKVVRDYFIGLGIIIILITILMFSTSGYVEPSNQYIYLLFCAGTLLYILAKKMKNTVLTIEFSDDFIMYTSFNILLKVQEHKIENTKLIKAIPRYKNEKMTVLEIVYKHNETNKVSNRLIVNYIKNRNKLFKDTEKAVKSK